MKLTNMAMSPPWSLRWPAILSSRQDGNTFSKSGHIADNADSAPQMEISDMAEVNVRMQGDVAVVTGSYHEKGMSKAKSYESRVRATDM
jgi:hypothetical protein